MAIKELTGFLKEGLERGLPREQLEEVLLEAGWAPDQVRGALGGFADVTFPIPVPRPKPYVFAREAFVYLVLFSTLYVSAFNLGGLLFQFINQAFPDPSADPAFALEASRLAIRWSISLLVVAFPVFVFVSWTNERAVRRDPSRRLSKVRRWLTYMTLFLAARHPDRRCDEHRLQPPRRRDDDPLRSQGPHGRCNCRLGVRLFPPGPP